VLLSRFVAPETAAIEGQLRQNEMANSLLNRETGHNGKWP
jgi:hypothetical protein